MDRQVDMAGLKRFFNLFDEDALAVKTRRRNEAGLLHAVAGGANDFEFDRVAGIAEGVEDVVGLPERELRASGADADRSFHIVYRIRDGRGSVGVLGGVRLAKSDQLRVKKLGSEGAGEGFDRFPLVRGEGGEAGPRNGQVQPGELPQRIAGGQRWRE